MEGVQLMTSADDPFRRLFGQRRARDQQAADHIFGHVEAREMLADAVARTPEPTEAELMAEAETMLAEAAAGDDQEGITDDHPQAHQAARRRRG